MSTTQEVFMFSKAVFFFVCAAGVAGQVIAGSFPERPVKLVVPFAAGGPADTLARVVGQAMTGLWRQQVVVENRGGAGGTVGLDYASRAPRDGYTLAIGASSNLTVAPALYDRLPYDPLKDFVPVGNIAAVPYALAVNPTVPAGDVKSLVALAGKKPEFLSYGSSGIGSMSSLAAELFKSLSGTRIVHVPYKGTAPALTDVVSGQIDLMFADLAVIRPHRDHGRLRVLGVTSAKRISVAADIPTIVESGLPGYVVEPWFGIVTNQGVSPEVLRRLNDGLNAALRAAEVSRRLRGLGYEPIGGESAQFLLTIRNDLEKYAGVVKRAGIKATL
jgi:tripartite-type tricarboxylate transporter receptor subunit TctC